jgi:Helicase conserved C-terminal domain/Domain of unknown function (DUF3883)
VGGARQSIALTRTVFQRRLASSTYAIFESLKRRLQKQQDLRDKIKEMPEKERIAFLRQRRGISLDDEVVQDDDLSQNEIDQFTNEFTVAEGLNELEDEIVSLKELVNRAERVYKQAQDTKLQTLMEQLKKAEFTELKDGAGKLLIFTEHRDTLSYLRENLEQRFSCCEIHGQMDAQKRKKAQHEFRTSKQICIATEAAGEGINLQFCHLMINYDIPWNPARLEQRMGRIHRIGQTKDVYVFNFVADEAVNGEPIIEGKVLRTLYTKLEKMRAALGEDRVYDVIGEILSINEVDISEILRDATHNPHKLDEYLEKIEGIDPQKLKDYEEMTGIALARAYVDFPTVQRSNFIAEEKRLMPVYIEKYFSKAAGMVGLTVERRADGLLRIRHVPASFRSSRMRAARRFGKLETDYKKITFHKEDLVGDQYSDAELVSPGHPLYAAVDEKLVNQLKNLKGSSALMVDINTSDDYWVHFLEFGIVNGNDTTIHKELAAIKESGPKAYSLAPPEILHDFAPYSQNGDTVASFKINQDIEPAKDYLIEKYQLAKRRELLEENRKRESIVKKYLDESFEKRIFATQKRIMKIKASEEERGDITRLERELTDLEETKRERIKNLDSLTVLRNGPVTHIASFLILAPKNLSESGVPAESQEEKDRSEKEAMRISILHEVDRGWEPEDVSAENLGFDIRSIGPPDSITGFREVRRIEVKGRMRGKKVVLTENEWLKAKQLNKTYWLYAILNPTRAEHIIKTIPDPANTLEFAVNKVLAASYEIDGGAIERFEIS